MRSRIDIFSIDSTKVLNFAGISTGVVVSMFFLLLINAFTIRLAFVFGSIGFTGVDVEDTTETVGGVGGVDELVDGVTIGGGVLLATGNVGGGK